MPYSVLPQNHDRQELFKSKSSFFRRFHVTDLLHRIQCTKGKGCFCHSNLQIQTMKCLILL